MLKKVIVLIGLVSAIAYPLLGLTLFLENEVRENFSLGVSILNNNVLFIRFWLIIYALKLVYDGIIKKQWDSVSTGIVIFGIVAEIIIWSFGLVNITSFTFASLPFFLPVIIWIVLFGAYWKSKKD